VTPDPWALLLDTARRATERSHAPYSGVPVGAAAAETTDSRVLEGSNTECASIGLSLCAECALVSECCWTTVPTASTSCCPGGSGRPTFAGCAASRDGAQPTS
jgi:cytidine deaminase